MVLLLARPWIGDLPWDPTAVLIALFATLGIASVLLPVPQLGEKRAEGGAVVLALCGGVLAFSLARLVAPGRGFAPWGAHVVLLNSLAAVSEEALFRRLLYGALLRWGPAAAVLGSAIAFAVVHVTVWGPRVLPLDLAAGFVLSWQRLASDRWSVPAITHVAANVLAVI